MEFYKTFKNNAGQVLAICHDTNPDKDLLNFNESLMNYFTWESRSPSIEENDFRDAEEWYDSLLGDGMFNKQREKSLDAGRSKLGFVEDLCNNLAKKAGILAFPILKHEHSGVCYYLGDTLDRWDGSVAGFVWEEKSLLRKKLGVSKLMKKQVSELEKQVKNDLAAYTDYANGNIYGFKFFDADGLEENSCWGFFGYEDDQEMLKEMLAHVDPVDEDFVEVELEISEVENSEVLYV